MNNSPIAVFDSGLGGLSVWRELRRALPGESLMYFGDGKNCPYGPKPREQVIGYIDDAVRFVLERGAKMVVVACNAATAAGIDYLREHYDVPFVGMEPAVKPAALTTRTGVVGILATKGTLAGRLYLETATKYSSQAQILSAVGEGFVELVEAGLEDSPQAVEAVSRAILPMLEQGADRIVLGCTHYPFLAGAMRKVIDSHREIIGDRDVWLIDPAPAVARRTEQILKERGIEAEPGHKAEYEFYTAHDDEYLSRIIAKSEQALTMNI